MCRYYVYELAEPNALPFYVGKGTGERIGDHEIEARQGCTCSKCKIIRELWGRGLEVERRTVFRTDDEAAAYAYEVHLIALYGRQNLTNRTDGGLGLGKCNPATIAAIHAKRIKTLQRKRIEALQCKQKQPTSRSVPKMLTVEEAAAVLHLSEQTVQRYVRTGRLPASKIGRRYLIPESAVEELLEPKQEPPIGGEAQS
jgi:excisionase family DNA binding protein